MSPDVERAIIASGIILIKYWLEVSMENQEERLKARDKDPRKIWKLSPMDLKSYTHWYDYSRARDEMFAATDTADSPWFVVDGNDKRRARLNCITHLLNQIPYEEVPREPVKFPKRKGRAITKNQTIRIAVSRKSTKHCLPEIRGDADCADGAFLSFVFCALHKLFMKETTRYGSIN